jgi:hypothetical protein
LHYLSKKKKKKMVYFFKQVFRLFETCLNKTLHNSLLEVWEARTIFHSIMFIFLGGQNN